MTRRLGFVSLSVVGLMLLIHTAAWLVVTGRIRDGMPEFIAAAAENGWHVEAGQTERAGWPWAATMRLTDVQAERQFGSPAAPVPLRWRLRVLDVTFSPADPAALHIVPYGQQTVAVGAGEPLPIGLAHAFLRIPLAAGAASLEAGGLTAGPLRIERITARVSADTVSGQLDGIQPATTAAAPFDSPAALSFRLRTDPAWPLAATPRDAATAWRQAGGTLNAPELTLRWGPLDIAGSATGGLDAALQPTGTGQFRVAGAQAALETAGRAGLLQPGAVSAARTVVTVLTLAAPGRPIALPVTLVNQMLTVAGFPLLKVPPLSWDQP